VAPAHNTHPAAGAVVEQKTAAHQHKQPALHIAAAAAAAARKDAAYIAQAQAQRQ
jgi:hypothetical protein